MKQFRPHLLILAFLLLCAQTTIAQKIIYVNDNSTANGVFTSAVGNDANSGSDPSAPFASLTKAMQEAVSGDRILLDAGTYLATSITVKSGVKIIGTPSDNTIITAQTSAISLQSNTELWNLKIQRVLPLGPGYPSISVATAPGATNVLIENCFFFKNRTAIYVEPGSTDIVIKRNRFEDNRTGVIFPDSPSGVTPLSKVYLVDNDLSNNRSYGFILAANANSPIEAYLSGNNITGNLAGGLENDNTNSGTRIILRNNWFGSASPTIYAGNTNGGFNVDDHDQSPGSATLTNNNSIPGVHYPNQISGTNTAAIQSGFIYASAVNTRPGTVNYVTSNNTNISGNTSFAFFPSIKDAISASNTDALITLPDGIYSDNIIINKKLTVKGISRNAIIRGTYDYGNQEAVVAMNTAESKIETVTIRRDYGSSEAVWKSDKRDFGIIVNARNVTINDVTIQDQRNGIYAYGQQGMTVTNSLIEKNRTGFLLGVDVSNGVVTNNIIRNNFTHGFMFNYDFSNGFTANNFKLKSNSFSGNWYTDIYANGAGSAGIFNNSDFTCNTFGTNAALTNPVSAAETGYAIQSPAQFGGTPPAPFVGSFAGSRIDELTTAPWLVNIPVPNVTATSFVLNPDQLNVSPVTPPLSAANNDYRILANAIGCVLPNQTVNLTGNFDWTSAEALADWAKGTNAKSSDGIGTMTGSGDNYSITPPTAVDGVTLTSSGSATIQGPGDLAVTSLETFLFLNNKANSSYKNWTISNLIIKDFDVSIIADLNGGSSDVINNLKITGNQIYIPADLNATAAPSDNLQNIGIHYTFGNNIEISGNKFFIDGTGTSDDAGSKYSATYAIMSNTSGGTVYDGLKINNNEFTVTGVPTATPSVIKGIWENGHNEDAGIVISGNKFINDNVGNTANLNRQTAFWVTSKSGSTKTVVYQNNEISKFSEGIAWLGGLYTSNTAPDFNIGAVSVQILNNKFDAVNKGVVIRKSAGSTNENSPALVNNNSFTGSITNDIANEASGTTDASCNWFDDGALISGAVTISPKLVNGTDDQPATVGFQTSAACEYPVKNLVTSETFPTIQAAIDDPETVDGNAIFISNGTYNERVTVSKQLTLTGESEAGVILDGTGLAGTGSGIVINSGKTNVIIQTLTIQNFTGTSGNNHAGIYAIGGNNELNINHVSTKNNISASGIYANGPVENVSITYVTAENNGGSARGIVIWNGFKKNITITNSTITNNSCCGIELQDGSASGVLIKDNVIVGVDNAIGLVGLTSGAGPNIIEGNTITVNGRFGIEIKNPNGTGSTDPALDGSIIVRGNTVTLGVIGPEVRDLAGISVYRRGVITSNGNVDVPTGVVITGNTVSGFAQPSASEGFGIVVEGTNHKITGNTLSGNDVAIQRQAGNLPYTANSTTDAIQDNLADQYFGRGNAPYSCGIEVADNGGAVVRDVSYSDLVGVVVNTNTGETFCSIQTAVTDAETVNGNIIKVGAGTFNEQVKINKSLTIKSATATQPVVNFSGTVSGRPALFDITADQVTIENFNFKVDLSILKSAILAADPSIDQITIKDNKIDGYGTPAGTYGDRNAVSVNYGGPTPYRVATNGVNNIVFTGNTVTSAGASSFRAGIATDESAGDFTGNTLATINHDIIVRFGSNGDINIKDNHFNGGGVELPEMNGSAGVLTVSGNTFDGTAANPVGAAMLRLKNNFNSKTVSVKDNIFTGHQWGISLENYQNVTLENNQLTPLSGSTVYRHITVNTKELSSSSGFYAPVVGMNLIKNTFNGSGINGGTALSFYNQDNDSPVFGTFTIGGASNENTFAADIAKFIYLDAETGPTAAPITTKAPWTANLDASGNKFNVGAGLQLPAEMTLASLFDLEDKIVHKIDDSVLGFVTTKTNQAFVTPLSFTAATSTAKIQRGIEAASTGWTEFVKAGTYTENVIVNKSIKVYGANYGINPNSGSRVLETIIVPAINNMTDGSVFQLQGALDGVEIDGFTIDGDNSAISGGVAMNAADVNSSEGISAYDGVKNTLVKNNIIQNLNYAGVDLYNDTNGGAATSGNLVSQNKFDNIIPATFGIGVLIYNNAYANISNNVMTRVRLGIQTGNFSQADPGDSHTFESNIIEAGRKGIFHNLAYQNAANFNIKNNIITALAGTTRHDGIMISSMANNVTAIVENNTITGIANVSTGYQLWNNPSNLVTIKGGTVSNVQNGVFANNFDGYPDAGSNAESSAYTIDGVTINNAATGILVKDNPSNTNAATVKVTLAGNTLIDQPGSQGIVISGKDAQLITGPAQIKLGSTTMAAVSISGTTSATSQTLILKTGFAVNRNGNTSASVIETDLDAIVEVNGDFTIPSGGPTYPFIIQGKLWFENGVLNAESAPVYFTSTASDIVVSSKPETTTSYILGRAIMAGRAVNGNALNFLGVNLPSGADLGMLGIERITSNSTISPALSAGSINERWIITPGNGNGRTGVKFSFLSNFLNGQNASALYAYRYNGTTWQNKSSVLNTSAIAGLYTTPGFNISEFSPWTFSSSSSPLPVNLVAFNAVKNEQTAVLNWSTTAETNSDHFDIEHSLNGKNWELIGTVAASGESRSLVSYTFDHTNPADGENLYRLKMIDKDETFAYSRIVSLNFGFGETISIFPNPATDLLQINMKDWNKVKTIKLVDLNGNTVYSSTKAGLSKTIDVKSLTQGMYVMEISGENGKISARKIVISK